MASTISTIVLTLPFTFVLWAFLHEYAHYFVGSRQRKVTDVKYMLYPHVHPVAGFRWAAISWRQHGEPLRPEEQFHRSLAPRVPDGIGCFLLFSATHLPGQWSTVVVTLLFGAVVDLFVGSTGMSEHSDLRRASRAAGWSPWKLRIMGMAVVLATAISITPWVWGLFC